MSGIRKLFAFLDPWILAARPKTLPAAVSPILVGFAITYYFDQFRFLPAFAALICAIFIQIGTNYTNDVSDYLAGHDQSDRIGPLRVTQAGLLSPKQVIMGAGISFGIAAASGLYLAYSSGWIVLVIGVACILAGIVYSTGPFALVKFGLAGLFVLIFFGFVAVASTVYVIMNQVPIESWFGGLGVGVLTVNILVVNNIRDIDSDKRARRINIPVLYGRRAGEYQYLVMLIIAYLVPFLLFFSMGYEPLVFAGMVTLPFAIKDYKELLYTPNGKHLNKKLANTGKILLIYSIGLCVSFILSRLF